MHGKSRLVRGGAAMLAASAALLVASPAALAESGEAKGRVVYGGQTDGYQVNFGDKFIPIPRLFTLKLSDGSKLKVYCVEVKVDLQDNQDMIERPWNKFPNAHSPFTKNRDKLNWVLHHGYPANKPSAIEEELGKKDIKLNDGLSEEEAITATQAAVWHFSDDQDLDRTQPLAHGPQGSAADVLALYDFLTGDDNVGIGAQPKPTLNISAKSTEGEAGTRIGPFTVATTGEITELTSQLPKGVKLTDADGKELKTADVKDGSELYVDVPKDAKKGTADFALTAIGHLDTGRLFVGENYDKEPAQSLIVAQSEKTTVKAEAAAKWNAGTVTPPTSETSTPPSETTTAAPPSSAVPTTAPSVKPQSDEGSLPTTGVNAAVPITVGALLVLGGALTLFLLRRRRNNAA